MAVRDDLAEIRGGIHEAEADLRTARRSLRALHNLLAEKMVENKDLLGLSDEDITVFGGGTPKPPVEE